MQLFQNISWRNICSNSTLNHIEIFTVISKYFTNRNICSNSTPNHIEISAVISHRFLSNFIQFFSCWNPIFAFFNFTCGLKFFLSKFFSIIKNFRNWINKKFIEKKSLPRSQIVISFFRFVFCFFASFNCLQLKSRTGGA